MKWAAGGGQELKQHRCTKLTLTLPRVEGSHKGLQRQHDECDEERDGPDHTDNYGDKDDGVVGAADDAERDGQDCVLPQDTQQEEGTLNHPMQASSAYARSEDCQGQRAQ